MIINIFLLNTYQTVLFDEEKMKGDYTAKDPKEYYLKYKPDFGSNYDALIDICTEWEKFCTKNMFDPTGLKEIIKNDILDRIKKINEEVDLIHSGGIKSFLIEMINGQHTALLIPYLMILP